MQINLVVLEVSILNLAVIYVLTLCVQAVKALTTLYKCAGLSEHLLVGNEIETNSCILAHRVIHITYGPGWEKICLQGLGTTKSLICLRCLCICADRSVTLLFVFGMYHISTCYR